MRLDDSKKISLNYIFSYILIAIYKISWSVNNIKRMEEVYSYDIYNQIKPGVTVEASRKPPLSTERASAQSSSDHLLAAWGLFFRFLSTFSLVIHFSYSFRSAFGCLFSCFFWLLFNNFEYMLDFSSFLCSSNLFRNFRKIIRVKDILIQFCGFISKKFHIICFIFVKCL